MNMYIYEGKKTFLGIIKPKFSIVVPSGHTTLREQYPTSGSKVKKWGAENNFSRPANEGLKDQWMWKCFVCYKFTGYQKVEGSLGSLP